MVTPYIVTLLASGMFAAAIVIITVGVMQRTKAVTVRDRLESLGGAMKPQVKALEEIELSKPFMDRVVKPLLHGLARTASRLAPGSKAEAVAQKLAMAGNPRSLTVETFLGLKVVAAVVGAAVVALMQVLMFTPSSLVMGLIWIVVGGVAGFFLPDLWIKDEIRKRQKAIRKVLPDTIDVLSISVEAGLGFDAAMARICQKAQNPLTAEFDKYLTEIRLGKGRREALRMIQTRTGVDDLNSFIGSIIQADQLGVSIARTLRVQSEQLRVKRRQRAEQLAQKAPLKMLFPMILFIFPSIFVVILGPSIKEMIGVF